MGIFDLFKKKEVKQEEKKEVATAAKASAPKGNQKVTFTFNAIPSTLEEFKALPEMSLDTPFKTTALAMLALLNWEKNNDLAYQMLDALRGPNPMSPMDKSFIKDRLRGKEYKVRSFFKGTSPDNSYTMSTPLTITVEDNPYSYAEENYATMHLQSSGADAVRPVKLRKKPSTGQWFIIDIQVLADIRIPKDSDPWA